MSRLFRILLPVLVLGLAYFAYVKLAKKPPPEPVPPRERAVLTAQGIPLKREPFTVTIETQGVTRAHNQTSLTPRVSGRIQTISPLFEDGAFFKEDDVLIELDPTDFEAAVDGASARVARAEAALVQEDARSKQALMDWQDLGYATEPTDLVLRKPQLKEAVANVKAAESELTDALNELSRTKVRAPYDGRVHTRLVGLGQSVTSGTKLGDVFSVDSAEVRLPLSAREFSRIKLPATDSDPPVSVTLTDALLDENPATWDAKIIRSEGALDERSRKLFVIARMEDPFGLATDRPSLRIGQPVRATIRGEVIPDAFVIPRKALYRPNEVLLVDPADSTLQPQKIEPIWSDDKNLIVLEGLTEGWTLVTERLGTAPRGAKVNVLPPGGKAEPEAAEAGAEQSGPENRRRGPH